MMERTAAQDAGLGTGATTPLYRVTVTGVSRHDARLYSAEPDLIGNALHAVAVATRDLAHEPYLQVTLTREGSE